MFDLKGQKGLIVGIANDHSIAYGCAKSIFQAGGEIAATYLNDKAKPFVEPLTKGMGVPDDLLLKMNVTHEEEVDNVFKVIEQKWGKLDFLIHSIAFARAEDLKGRVVDTSQEGFAEAMNISCHTLARFAKRAEPLMKDGGTILTMTYFGADEVINNYGVMGPVKAALQSTVRYLAAELGPQKIRVNAISPGPVSTRAGSGIKDFDELLETAAQRAPLRRLVTPEDVGALAAFLISEGGSCITGGTIFIDGGYHIVG